MIQEVLVYFIGFWFWLWSIVDVLTAGASRIRFGKKSAWLALVTLVPVLGGIVYLVFGRYVPEPKPNYPVVAPRDDDADPRDEAAGDEAAGESERPN